MRDLADTICALSTPAGRAGIAVVRLSGDMAFRVADNVFVPDRVGHPPRTAVLGRLVDRAGEVLDQALVTRFTAPNSYTGEDVVEISMHGSPVLVGFVLDALCASGARLAEPGEFTMRAFLHQRMDLAQAEAVNDIIRSATLFQARVAERQRSGELSRNLSGLKQQLRAIVVQLESAVEFAEQDIPIESRDAVVERIETALGELRRWIASFRRGRLVREGFSLALVGRANVGKSSIFNVLLSDERSIVTETPGTTRDLVSESMSLNGIPVRLLDTAGVREPEGRVEELGIDRSYRAMADADIRLLVVDTSVAVCGEDLQLRERLGATPLIIVMNKADLESAWTQPEKSGYAGEHPAVTVSALTGCGIEELKRVILDSLMGSGSPEQDGVLVTNVRHYRCLEAAGAHLQRAQEALRGNLSEEFVLFDLYAALRETGAITGETGVEDVLDQIFSRFCVGK